MSLTGLAIIYIIIWWIVFFAILPIDVNRTKIVKIDGEDPGSSPSIFTTLFLSTSIGKIAKKIIHHKIIYIIARPVMLIKFLLN